jgi:chemotaxis protein MotB
MRPLWDDVRRQLDELRVQVLVAEARGRLHATLANDLRRWSDAGALAVVLRDERIVVSIPGDRLFARRGSVVDDDAMPVLRAVAHALQRHEGRRFQVAGHVSADEAPGAAWELSTRRATNVVRILEAAGLSRCVISAAGYGDVDPLASNVSPEGRARNRRIEITVEPAADEIVGAP